MCFCLSNKNLIFVINLIFFSLLSNCQVYKSSDRHDFENEYVQLQQNSSNAFLNNFKLINCQKQSIVQTIEPALFTKQWIAEINENENFFQINYLTKIFFESEKWISTDSNSFTQYCYYEKTL